MNTSRPHTLFQQSGNNILVSGHQVPRILYVLTYTKKHKQLVKFTESLASLPSLSGLIETRILYFPAREIFPHYQLHFSGFIAI